MSFDLAGAKTRLNIVGTAQDVEIQAALDASLAIAEAYCNRKFAYADVTEEAVFDGGGRLSLERYPVDHITKISAKGYTNQKYDLNKRAGLLFFHSYGFSEFVDVTYGGGYVTLPDDLVVALYSIFDGIWAASQGSTGPSVGAIESVSLTGVGTVRMSTGGSASTGGASGAVPAMASAILSAYRRELA